MLWAIDESEKRVAEIIGEIRKINHPGSRFFSLEVFYYDGWISKSVERKTATLSVNTEFGARFRFDTWGVEKRWAFGSIKRLEKFLIKTTRRKEGVRREVDNRIAKYNAKVARKWKTNFDGVQG